MKQGDLARLIDVNGDDRGICVFINKRRLTPEDKMSRGFINSYYWHFEVLHENAVKLLNTSDWTLIPV